MTTITTLYRLKLAYKLRRRPRETEQAFTERHIDLEVALTDEASGSSPDLNEVIDLSSGDMRLIVEHESFNALSDLAPDLEEVVKLHKGILK